MRLLIVVAAAVFVVGCRRADPPLVVYSAGPRPLIGEICDSYTREHGRPVELFSATTGQIMAKLEAERFNPRADVVIVANQTAALGLKAAGRLMAYRPAGVDSTETDWHDGDGFYHATAAAVVGIAGRDEKPPEVSKGWRAVLLTPGRLVMPSPGRSGTAGDFILSYKQMHPDTFWQDFLAARALGLQIVGANSQAITGLLIGAYDAVYAAADYIICREIEKGEPLTVAYPPGGSPYVLRPAAILESTRNPPAAQAFLDHLFTQQVQVRIAARHLLPALRSVPLSAVRSRFPVPEPLPFNALEALEEQKSLARRFQYEIERAEITGR